MLHKFDNETKRDIYEFESVIEFAEFVDANVKESHSRSCPPSSFDNHQSWDDAIRRASIGNREDVKKLFDNLTIWNDLRRDSAQQEVRDVSGEYFDVAEYLSGEPECFRAMTVQECGKPVIPLMINCSMAYNIKAEEIINRGTAVVALCDELESQGYIIDMKVVFASQAHGMRQANGYPNRNGRHYTSVKIQNRPLDIDGLSFCVINPAFLRRLYLGLLEYSYGLRSIAGVTSVRDYDLSGTVFDDDYPGFYFQALWSWSDARKYSTLESSKEHVLSMVDKFNENPQVQVAG
jgi:hypothetical protein